LSPPVEKGAIVSSPDGVSWTLRSTASTNEWLGTAFGNGINVIVGYRTESLFSYMRSAASPTLGNWDVRDTGPLMYHSAAALRRANSWPAVTVAFSRPRPTV
jgi:hypothetical protein